MKKVMTTLFTILFCFSGLFSQNNPDSFDKPFIDVNEWRDIPVRHRYIHGGFEGNNTRFSLYLPPEESYQGRFFQYITPAPDNEYLSQGRTGEEDRIGFSISHGAYFIETNGGGYGASGTLVGAYQANAAVAQYSRVIASGIYGDQHHYGYAFGGSGGAYRTIGGIENTEGVWDGVVPFVPGSPVAIPNVFSIRMHAMRILHNKFPQILDALEPGGSGDMYAGLNEEEAGALAEVTGMGFPPESWFGYQTMGLHGFTAIYSGMAAMDPSYFEHDFWNLPGYLGADPASSIHQYRLQHTSRIKAMIDIDEAVRLELIAPISGNERGTADAAWKSIRLTEDNVPVAFQLQDSIPDVNFLGGEIYILSGAAAGKTLQAVKTEEDKVVFWITDLQVLALIRPGDEIRVDNSNFLAAQTYHRHQDPGTGYKVWEQFRDEKGNPRYPQRHLLLGPIFTKSAAGVVPSGKFKGKMILISCLWDREAYPWQADWYREQVVRHLGNDTGDHFRLWYVDRALHGDFTEQEDPTQTISFLGVLQQALLDLSDWVEKGISPSPTSGYNIDGGQVIIPRTATGRKGIQPVIDLKANGSERADIQSGETVILNASIEIPPNTGRIIAAEWDMEGNKQFREFDMTQAVMNKTGTKATLQTSHTYSHPGTYFVTIRAISQRNGDTLTPYTRIQNLARVRIVVE